MTHLSSLKFDDGSVIYIEAQEDVIVPTPPASEGTTRTSKGVGEVALKQFQTLQGTIRAYTSQTLSAFNNIGVSANVDKVTLEFGVKVGGEMSIPYIAKSSSDCNLKITVECSFPK